MAVLVAKQAPNFTASAVLPNNEIKDITLSEFTRGKYVALFFYPMDFTFVCPSELLAFDHRLDEFKKRNVEVLSVSVDSAYTHLAWKNTPVDKGGIGSVRYTMVSDVKHEISKAYDVASEGGVAFRGTFLIDKAGIVQHQIVNNLSLGRDVDELLRVIDALQFTEEHGEVCPAGWKKGAKGIAPSPEGVANYLAENGSKL